MDFKFEYLNNIETNTTDMLVDIWEESVRQTHHFLMESDISSIKEQVKKSLPTMDFLIGVIDTTHTIRAFMAVKQKKIEMLFVAPTSMKMGLGKALIKIAIHDLRSEHVDVNSDNKNAIGFYKHMGFEIYSYSRHDEFNNPFPIVHMKRSNKGTQRCSNRSKSTA